MTFNFKTLCTGLLTFLFINTGLYAQTYCTPAYVDGCIFDDNINDFTLTGETTSISSTGTGCSPGSYSVLTTMSADMVLGTAYSGTVTTEYSDNEYVRIWIDYNSDGTFSATEAVADFGPFGSASPVAFTIIPPLTAAPGSKRMRVRLVYSPGGDIDPCTEYDWGEVHDYSVTLTAPVPPCEPPASIAASAVTTTTAIINWVNVTPPLSTLIEYGPAGFTPGSGTLISPATTPDTLTGLIPNTDYDYYIRNVCSPADTSAAGTPSTFSTLCLPPSIATATGDTVCDEGSGILSATASGSAVVRWYDAAAGTTLLYTGTVYATPVHTATTTYYAQAEIDGGAAVCTSDAVPVVLLVSPSPSVSITPDELTVCPGTSATFEASFDPDYTYAWSSGEMTTAITTNTPGTYTVTVTDEFGCSGSANALLDTFTSIGVAGFDYVSDIFTSPLTYSFTAINPVAVKDYYWDFGDGHTSAEESPTHTYASFGNYNVGLLISNDCESATIVLNINVEDANFVIDPVFSKSVSIFPNPAREKLTAKLNQQDKVIRIQIFNTLGQLVSDKEVSHLNEFELDLSHLNAGNYFLLIRTEDNKRAFKPFIISE